MPRVNPDILAWARETAGMTLEQAAKAIGLKESRGVPGAERLASLERGDAEPSRTQLLKMANQYRRPLLAFYLAEPPRRGERGQDFRTLPEDHSPTADALLDAVVRDVRARQSMVRSILEADSDTPRLSIIGSKKLSDGVPAVQRAIVEALNFKIEEFRAHPTADKAFSYLRERAENAGIFVLLIGNLGSHHTALDVETFRGFALADDVAPFVVINDQDARAAWSFTLLHELAHLWLGQTGISGAVAGSTLERFCNDVASQARSAMKHLVVRVVTDQFVGDQPATQLWIVVSNDPTYALNAVKERVPVAWKVEMTDYGFFSETIERLGLAPGQTRMM